MDWRLWFQFTQTAIVSQVFSYSECYIIIVHGWLKMLHYHWSGIAQNAVLSLVSSFTDSSYSECFVWIVFFLSVVLSTWLVESSAGCCKPSQAFIWSRYLPHCHRSHSASPPELNWFVKVQFNYICIILFQKTVLCRLYLFRIFIHQANGIMGEKLGTDEVSYIFTL